MSLLYALPAPLLSALFALVLVGALALGFRHGARTAEHGIVGPLDGLTALETVVFGLFGLLLALTLTYAAGRADGRRRLEVDEANAIGSAWLRCALLPDADRRALEGLLRRYLDERIAHTEAGADHVAADAALARATALQQAMWTRATAVAVATPTPVVALVPAALNEMFDLESTRLGEEHARLPDAIVLTVFTTASVTALVAGYALGLGRRLHPLATAGFVLLTLLVVYVIIDLDRPRRGLFRVEADALVTLRATLPSPTP